MTTVICPRWPEQSQGFILFQCETAFNDAQLGFHFRFWNIPHAVYAAASWTYGLGDGSGSGGERKAAPDEFQFNSTSGHRHYRNLLRSGPVAFPHLPNTLTPATPQSTSGAGTQTLKRNSSVYLHHTLSPSLLQSATLLHLSVKY